MNYKKAFIGLILITLTSGCAAAPAAKPTAFVPIMKMFNATESPTDVAAGTPGPANANTTGVTSTRALSGTVVPAASGGVGISTTQTVSATAAPAIDLATMFADFDTLCKVVTAMNDAQQSAFAQQNKGRPIGPWRGRAKEVVPKAAVSLIMNRPDFNPAAGTNLVVNLVNTQADYTANKVYSFYGTFISAGGSSPKDCQVLMQADGRESQNTAVGS